jgi:hypothetical protein
VSPRLIVVSDVKHDLVNEFFLGVPDTAGEDLAAEDVKPRFPLAIS